MGVEPVLEQRTQKFRHHILQGPALGGHQHPLGQSPEMRGGEIGLVLGHQRFGRRHGCQDRRRRLDGAGRKLKIIRREGFGLGRMRRLDLLGQVIILIAGALGVVILFEEKKTER